MLRPPSAWTGDWQQCWRPVPSQVSQRLPHLWAHDVAKIDAEVREALTEIGNREANQWSA